MTMFWRIRLRQLVGFLISAWKAEALRWIESVYSAESNKIYIHFLENFKSLR